MTDNASNYKSAFSNSFNYMWVPCFTHTLHLAVSQIFNVDKVNKLMTKAKEIVTYIHSSPKANLILKDNEEMLDIPDLTLIQQVPVCWNSFFDMSKRPLDERNAICVTLFENHKGA